MAAVLDALAARVMNTIMDMGEEKIGMLLGVSHEIKKLEANVKPLRNFLTDAERRRITDKSVQAWVTKLKSAMYEATDILDLCQLDAMDRQEKQHSSGLCLLLREKLSFLGCLGDILQPFLFCVKNPGFANEVAGRIKKLNDELATIRMWVADFKFIELGSYEERRRPQTSSASYPRRENAQFVQSELVGDQIKKNTQELVHKLIDDGHHEHGSSAVRVVAIVGQGGIGKSTLAKKAFANEAIKEEFKIKIWLSVTQQFTKVDLLRAAISQAGGKHGENKDDETLLEALTDALSKRKFLLVLDDVWNQEAWDDVLRVPVLIAGATQPGSRVLVTSRKDDVVRSMGASILRVNILDDEDAWCLLKKQLLQPQVGVQSDFDELKDVGMKIVKKCDGLPLAIKVMGGLLSRRDPKKHVWEIVLQKNLDWKEEYGLQEELNYSVRLSYDDLSPELKQCLLYYSLFPKGSGFTEDRVISMWISEGFVQHDGRESDQLDLEQIGADYHRELVARNLLEPYYSTDNIRQYTLRDVLRSFAQFMAKEEAFVVHKDQADSRNLLPENKKFRSLSIELSDSKLELTTLEKQETLRTLLIGCEIKPGGSLANFASLRVLDISSKESDWLVDSLCELRHLRYLSFSNTNISRLPGDIHKMRFLEHIHLMNCTKLEKLPNSITKLACLRHLSLYGSNVDVIPRRFGGLTNLRTLHGFPVKMDGDWCTLEELEALSHLRSLTVQSLENVPGSSDAKKAKISNKKSLEYLELNCYKDEEAGKEVRQIGLDQQQRIEAVFDELCPPPRLQTLIIKRYFGHQLPDWLHSPAATTFKSLKNIDLVHITYCTRLPDGLCRIHGLEKLLIKDAPAIEHVGPDFQTLARGDGGVAFPHMRILELIGLSGWKEWDWEEEQSKVKAMPALELLKLTECKLTHLPPGLASGRRYNLRTIHLANLSLLEFVENFPSVVELKVYDCPELKRISGLAKLRTINIKGCPKLKLLEGVLVLDSMELDWEHWEVVGPDARCIPKGYQAGVPRELPPYLTRVLNNLESILQNQSSRPHDVPLKHLEEITNNFSEERILGRGGFGVVYKGVLQNGEMIAVKKIVSSLMPGQQKQFENEVYHLMKLNHPNIVRFVGYCYDIKKVCVEYNGRFVSADMEERLLCLEFLPKGSLDKYISDESSGLDWSTCYNIIKGICSGLCYLHVQNDKPIIHLDLKPANILLSDGMLPKIADFGQSRLFDHQQTICTASRVGTLGYMAREFVDRGKITPEADIFSLGVIIIEVVTGHKDYPYIITKMSSEEFINLALEKWRNVLQRSPGYVSLETDCEQIKRCLQVGLICVNPDHTKRPPINKVISMLQGSESIDCDISNEATA